MSQNFAQYAPQRASKEAQRALTLPGIFNWATSLSLLGLLLSTNPAEAQTNNSSRWGAEVSAIGVGIFSLYQAKATYLLNPDGRLRSEVGLGFLIQPESTRSTSQGFNTNGIYSAKQLSLAYRLYVWKGLHFENVTNLGTARVRDNVVDGNDYKSFIVFNQTFIGYKFNFFAANRVKLFVIGQGGFGSVPYSSRQWPTTGGRGAVYGLGDLKIGLNF